MIRRILVGLGVAPYAGAATRHAVELATAHGAEVTGVTLFDPAGAHGGGLYLTGAAREMQEWDEERERIAQQAMEEAVSDFEAACDEADLDYHVLRESGDPLARLVSAGRYHDLVVCGLGGLAGQALAAQSGDFLVHLIRHGTQPILGTAAQHRPVRRVLVAYSGSPESAHALRAFVQLRPWPGCELYVAVFGRDAASAETLLDEAAAYCRAHGQEPRLRHVPKPPVEGILETARQWPADLLVMGDGVHGVLARKVLGDTLLQVVRKADRPLFLTH